MKLRHVILTVILMAGATLFVYGQLGHAGFINLDDDRYVFENPNIREGLTWKGVVWCCQAGLLFHSPNTDYWRPASLMSHAIDIELFGMNPGRHHLTNVVLHFLNAILVFLIFARMTGAGWRSAFVAAAFALHPVQVEAVAWVTARKDVLSSFFALLAVAAYARYARAPSAIRYSPVLLAFLLALLSKPMFMTFPFVLLLLDYWPLARFVFPCRPQAIGRLVLEKIPLMIAALFSVYGAFLGQKQVFEAQPLEAKVLAAPIHYLTHLRRIIIPRDLAVRYPPLEIDSLLPSAVAACVILAVSLLCLGAAKRAKHFGIGWLWFLGTLAPVIHLVDIAGADRFTYFPIIGLLLMAAWGVAGLRIGKRPLVLVVVVYLTMCASLARNQAAYWLDCEALFRHALAVTENNYVIHDCYGAVLADRGRSEEAARQFQAAIRARPRDEVAYYNLGVLLAKQKKYDAAVAMYQQALAIKPDYYEVQNNLGILLAEQGRLLEALTHLDRAVQLKSDDALAHKNMALLLGQFAEAPGEANDVVRQLAGGPPAAAALRHCQKALALSPAAPGLLGLMGYCLMLNNRREEAESYLRRALAANPDDAVAAYQLARLLDARGEAAESLLRLKKSVTPEADNHEAANAAARSRATSRD